jgi:hypothetical protein
MKDRKRQRKIRVNLALEKGKVMKSSECLSRGYEWKCPGFDSRDGTESAMRKSTRNGRAGTQPETAG